MPAQYVKPYVTTNKSDYLDAEAIAEAAGRPKKRFVPIKSDDQLDLQSLHRGTGALGDASHRSHQPDSWLTTGAWNHFAAGAMPCGCGLARDRRLPFGLASVETVERLEVRWPSGTITTLSKLPAEVLQARRALAVTTRKI